MKIIGHTRSAAIVSWLCQLTELFCSTQRGQIHSPELSLITVWGLFCHSKKSPLSLFNQSGISNEDNISFIQSGITEKKSVVAFQPIKNNETRDIRTRVPLLFFFSRTFWRGYQLEFVGGGESKSTYHTHKWAKKNEVLFETFYHEIHSFTTVANFWNISHSFTFIFRQAPKCPRDIEFFFYVCRRVILDRKFCTSLSHKKAAEHQAFVESNWFYEDKMTFIKGRRFCKRKTLPKD